jgi:hypothetical protein
VLGAADSRVLSTTHTNKHKMGACKSVHKNTKLLPTRAMSDGSRDRNWGSPQDAQLAQLVREGRVDPNSVRQGNFRQYAIQVTQAHFPDFIDINRVGSVNNAVKRLKNKLNAILTGWSISGQRGE